MANPYSKEERDLCMLFMSMLEKGANCVKYLHRIEYSEKPSKHRGVAIDGEKPKHPCQSKEGKEDHRSLQDGATKAGLAFAQLAVHK